MMLIPRHKPILASLVKFMLLTTSLYTDVSNAHQIFVANFDATPDWQNKGSQRCKYLGWDDIAKDDACANLPQNFDLIYVTDINPASPMCEITSEAARGKSGKGIRFYDESNGSKKKWGSECQIAKYFPEQHPELWASFYIRFNPEMTWESGTRMSKFFRAGHYNPLVVEGATKTSTFRVNNPNKRNNGLGRTTAGLFILNVKQEKSPDLMRLNQTVRCSTYKCGKYKKSWYQNFSGTYGNSWKDTLGDNDWHHVEIRMKMNSSVDAYDGIVEVYFDDSLQTQRDDIPWRMDGVEEVVTGFNMFSIGGNSHNVWSGQSNDEQWIYDIDELKICPHRCR